MQKKTGKTLATYINFKTSLYIQRIYIISTVKIEKVDVFPKVLNKQFIERLKAIFIINKTQLQIAHPYRLFRPLEGSSGSLIQIK